MFLRQGHGGWELAIWIFVYGCQIRSSAVVQWGGLRTWLLQTFLHTGSATGMSTGSATGCASGDVTSSGFTLRGQAHWEGPKHLFGLACWTGLGGSAHFVSSDSVGGFGFYFVVSLMFGSTNTSALSTFNGCGLHYRKFLLPLEWTILSLRGGKCSGDVSLTPPEG